MRACDLDLAKDGPASAVNGPYQYKNRDQNFLLTGQAALQGNSMAWRWHAEGWGCINEAHAV